MLKVGLTGGIGSGKSTVSEIFKVLGIPVFDADLAARKLMNEDRELQNQIRETFGEDAYTGGVLNRPYLADRVFNDPPALEKLNALVHPVTLLAAEKWAQEQTTPYSIKEAALIFEAGSAGELDFVIGVSAPENIRIERVMKRDQISRDKVLLRMDRQIGEEVKMKLCDFVLLNDERELLIPQVVALHEKLSTLAAQKI